MLTNQNAAVPPATAPVLPNSNMTTKLDVTSAPFTKSNTLSRNIPSINQNTTSAPASAVLPNRNVTPVFKANPRNWRDRNDYVLPEARNYYRIRRPPLIIPNWRDEGDREGDRNERTPHNWSNNKNRVRTTLPTQHDRKYIGSAWIQTAHKYTITFELVCHCLELCGLRKETVSSV